MYTCLLTIIILCIVKIQVICCDFNNKLATLGIQYNVCIAAATCVHVCVEELHAWATFSVYSVVPT